MYQSRSDQYGNNFYFKNSRTPERKLVEPQRNPGELEQQYRYVERNPYNPGRVYHDEYSRSAYAMQKLKEKKIENQRRQELTERDEVSPNYVTTRNPYTQEPSYQDEDNGEAKTKQVGENQPNDAFVTTTVKPKHVSRCVEKSTLALTCIILLITIGCAGLNGWILVVNLEMDKKINNTDVSSCEEAVITSRTIATPARSCFELAQSGFSVNGKYVIQPSTHPYEVYCDLEAGGWTLVATVNENGFDEVNYGDAWFFPNHNQLTTDYQNWVNENVFGSIVTCTRSDFKSNAYHDLQASDVMIRHVENNVPVEESSKASFLEYKTNNKFLAENGGNLKNLFVNKYPLQPSNYIYPDVQTTLNNLASRANEVTSEIPGFYDYSYENKNNYITDKESGMYTPRGAFIQLYAGSCDFGPIEYDASYSCKETNTIWSSRKSHPFIGILAVGDVSDIVLSDFSMRVTSYRIIKEPYNNFQGNLTHGNYKMQYHALCRFGVSTKSICDVLFVVINPVDWLSTENFPEYIVLPEASYYGSELRSSPILSNQMFGYSLFSSLSKEQIDENEIQEAMAKILLSITNTGQDMFSDGLPDINPVLGGLVETFPSVTAEISNFYFYSYEITNTITDNGSGMFGPYGLGVSLPKCNNNDLSFKKDYRCPLSNSIWSSSTSYPFFGLLAVGNFDSSSRLFNIEINSDTPSLCQMKYYNESLSNENFVLTYDATCKYGLTTPSICDVFFIISSAKIWGSTEARLFVQRSEGISYQYNMHAVDGPPTNLYMGYTLLSRKNGSELSNQEMTNAMKKILEIVSETQVFCPECDVSKQALTVPVEYTIGDASVVENMLPPSVGPMPTGFLQLRSFGETGSVYALCPAVKVENSFSRFVCVGGVRNKLSHLKEYNDFLDWNGYSGTANNKTYQVGFAHSQKDIDSTIMIFYR